MAPEPERDRPAAPAVPPDDRRAAVALFGERLALAERYADLLVTDGTVRGLVGPREAPRIWQRHLLNCAAVAELIPSGASVTDVGSGAGLPGLALAIARRDLTVTLVEPMVRRTSFLTEVVEQLGLSGTVTVERGRGEEAAGRLPSADVVTARALAPLDQLAAWCLPLARVGGRVLALKGASATEEVASHRDAVMALGGGVPVVHRCAATLLDPPAVVVEIRREREQAPGAARYRRPRSGRRLRKGRA
jgi:16S rRNA (guanine527-N7)-methyltransferase